MGTTRHHLAVAGIEPLEPRQLMSTYYVSTAGNNGAAGTNRAPWKTLQFAADHVVAGDTVIVAPGSYVGFDIRTSGTPEARITFQAQAGAVINQVNTRTNRDGINVENASYIAIDGFTLTGTNNASTSRAGIRVVGDGFDTGEFSKGVIVKNNNADRWGTWGIFTAFADDMLIQNNVCSRSVSQHGIYFSNSADRPIIRNNVCWGNHDCGIHMNADIFTGNTDLPGVDGIITGALVEGNICYDNGAGGGSAINCDGVRNSRFQNNLLYDNHSTGIALYQIDAAAPAVGNIVANNTIINASDSRFCLLVTDGAVNTTVFNNIFLNLHSSHGAIELSADSTSGFVSDYNLFDPRFSHSENFVNFSTWKSLTGGDAHSSTLSLAQMQALFTNYAGKDFTLASGSAAIDGGTSGLTNGSLKSAPTHDRLSATRPAGAGWDVGAYEFGAPPGDPDDPNDPSDPGDPSDPSDPGDPQDPTPPTPPTPSVKFASVKHGRLKVLGTNGDDAISVTVSGDTFTVTRNGVSADFSAIGVTSVKVYGYAGNDTITIGDGVPGSCIKGGSGDDVIQCGDGNDTIYGGSGNDQLHGGAGADKLKGDKGADQLWGEAGKDRLFGGNGDDLLDGGLGADRLRGDGGSNTLNGGEGDDYLFSRNRRIDQLFGGDGNDSAKLDRHRDVWSTLELEQIL